MVESTLLFIEQNAQLAWAVVFLIAFLESVAIIGLLMPGWVLLVGIGALIGSDRLGFYPIVLSAYFGAVIGEYFSYWLGLYYHRPILSSALFKKHDSLVEKGRQFFEKHGVVGVFFGRFLGPMRAILPFIAGVVGMPKRTFFWVNLTSGVIWAPLYLIPGLLAGAAYQLDKNAATMLLFVTIVIGVVAWIVYLQSIQWFKRRSENYGRHARIMLVNLLLSWGVLIVSVIYFTKSQYAVLTLEILSTVSKKLV